MRRRIAPAPQIGDTPKDLDFVETRLIVEYESGVIEILKLVDEDGLKSLEFERLLRLQPGRLTAIAFSGSCVIAAGSGFLSALCVWELERQKTEEGKQHHVTHHRFPARHRTKVTALAFRPQGDGVDDSVVEFASATFGHREIILWHCGGEGGTTRCTDLYDTTTLPTVEGGQGASWARCASVGFPNSTGCRSSAGVHSFA